MATTATPAISSSMRVSEILALLPEAAEIMGEYGLHCFSCSIGGVESLAEGCQMHGLTDEMIEELVDDLNQELKNTPKRPLRLTITPSAARGIAEIAAKEGREGQALRVEIDATGAFCLEFVEKAAEGDKIFQCDEEPEVKVCASPLTLRRIGGATIDVRDGRFKLDLPEEVLCGCEKKTCDCR